MPKPKRPNMTLREQEDAAKIQCYDWNAQYKEGVTVTYEELLGVVFRRRLHQFTGLAAVCA
ncbi:MULTISPECIES: hypothetical protein [Pseudomonas]|uniref:hypothetical protein n=1 Tax=Pseudomonas TaxID=286 RepID=UPI0005B4F872|nr:MULTISPECIES: hypothetical protein [Pseudomonas]MDC3951742.1 hypothetical protein [Pseudomonas aeruginosa]PMX05050.1 hypothetical protein C1Y25_29240 [Pseudomonas sp. MPBC4-3]PMX41732.1 hypothetical protein C1Y20_29490 [Pseudomonas sp. FW301-21B01]PMY02696.1 hypothetical protein C1Y18_29120 [Pseudomonas sp. MPR-R5A]PNA60670.1 hypothetical protein C1Y14_29850 [Pseudomonas sp. MPR-R5B]